jgi:transposase
MDLRRRSYNRFNRWRKAGVRDKLMTAIIEAHDGKVQMIDLSIVCVHQQAVAQKNRLETLVSVEVVED